MFIEIMLLKYCAGNSVEHEQVEFLRSLKLFVFESLGRMAELHLGSHLDNRKWVVLGREGLYCREVQKVGGLAGTGRGRKSRGRRR